MEQRKLVEAMAGFGIPEAQIAGTLCSCCRPQINEFSRRIGSAVFRADKSATRT
jgi:hypothetical protein